MYDDRVEILPLDPLLLAIRGGYIEIDLPLGPSVQGGGDWIN